MSLYNEKINLKIKSIGKLKFIFYIFLKLYYCNIMVEKEKMVNL